MKQKRLWHIIKVTKVIEELVLLFITMFLFAFVLLLVEPHINTYGDAIWFTFAVVTTTGFGDVVVITFLGRLISIILGLFGIFNVAIITSVIVNYYQHVSIK